VKAEQVEDLYELSPLQQGILLHSVQAPQSRTYVVQFVACLLGPLDRHAFERAWQRVVARQPVLRTSFHWEKLDKPVQVVHRRVKIPFEFHDWRSLDSAGRRVILDRLRQEHWNLGFSLNQAPLMRVACAQTGESEHILVWTYHHILMDGWSVHLLLHEISTCYEAFVQECEPELPPSAPFRNYIAWKQHQDDAPADAYWRRALQGFAAPTPIPIMMRSARCDSPAPATFRSVPVAISPEISAQLRTFVKSNHLTMSTIVKGALATLLARYSGHSDVLFGDTVSGRSDPVPGIESMVGLFINSVPRPARFTSTSSALEWLASFHDQLGRSRDFESSSLVRIRANSSIPTSLPLFHSLVVFERYPIEVQTASSAAAEPTLRLESFENSADGGTDLPLTLCLAETTRGLSGSLAFNVTLFEQSSVQRMLGHFETILVGFMQSSETPIRQLPLVSKREWRQFVARPARPVKKDSPALLHQLFERQAAKQPDAIAVCGDAQRWTYRQLNKRADAIAYFLRSQGLVPETAIGISARRNPAMVAALLGILKSGAAYVPLDPEYP
jgi:hypothetical protein